MKPDSLDKNRSTGQNTMYDYSDVIIHINPEPLSEENTDGETRYSWEISFNEPFSSEVKLEKISLLLSHDNYNVLLTAKNTTNIIAHTTFIKDSDPYVHDPSAVAHFKLFEDIEEMIGSINLIQGKKFADWWTPRRKHNL